MKNWVDIKTLEPKITRKSEETADHIFNNPLTPTSKHIAANYTRNQVLRADGLQRAIRETSRVTIDLIDILRLSAEELQAAFDKKLGRRNRSAGARALSRKYGKDNAERIIARKTGRHINLRN